jgi:hypothetical protein
MAADYHEHRFVLCDESVDLVNRIADRDDRLVVAETGVRRAAPPGDLRVAAPAVTVGRGFRRRCCHALLALRLWPPPAVIVL